MNIEPLLIASPAIQLHMLAAVGAFVLGAIVLWRRKGGKWHKINGRVWVGLMLVTALSGFFIHEIKLWGDYSPIHIISALVPFGLFASVMEARRRDIIKHQRIMKGTYLGGMIIAGGFTFLPGRLNHEIFFGANGEFLAVWQLAVLLALAVVAWTYLSVLMQKQV